MLRPAARSAQEPQWRAAALLIAGLTFARLAALFATPLELYPDEAQYWLWSRDLAFGYYSKPPLVAWAIAATTGLGGDAEPWVRLSAPLFQAGATALVYLIGRRLYGPAVGLAAAALYGLMPGVQLSALVMATDAPLLFFLALSTLAYLQLLELEGTAPPRRRLLAAAALGASLGLAFLAKYAAIYFVVGAALHLSLSASARRAATPAAVAVVLLVAGAFIAPNLAWNAGHGFATLHHTAANAAWGGRQLFNLAELARFVGAQFGVFGPIPFGALVVGVALAAWRRRLAPADLTLACFTLPPLAIVLGQAFVSRANANWSGAGYVTGAVLTAAWLVRWRARGWLVAALATQAATAAVFLALVIAPGLADRTGLSNAFKRARGWDDATRAVLDRADREPGLSAIAVNNRFLFYALAYYGRFEPHPPLTAWLLMDGPRNQAETTAPLTPALGRRVLAVSYEGVYRAKMQADFARTSGLEIASTRLDPRHARRLHLFIGEEFRPQPRDALSDRPTPP